MSKPTIPQPLGGRSAGCDEGVAILCCSDQLLVGWTGKAASKGFVDGLIKKETDGYL